MRHLKLVVVNGQRVDEPTTDRAIETMQLVVTYCASCDAEFETTDEQDDIYCPNCCDDLFN